MNLNVVFSATTANASSWKEHCNDELVKDIMNLYEIGRFLEFNFLSQSCEDVLMQLMTTRNVIDILNWSLQPHGSAWMARQAYQFMEDEFFSLTSNTEILGRVDEETLVRILKSDFTQVRLVIANDLIIRQRPSVTFYFSPSTLYINLTKLS